MLCFVCAEQVLEQADYLYSCGETEKLYQLLLQYKDRWGSHSVSPPVPNRLYLIEMYIYFYLKFT